MYIYCVQPIKERVQEEKEPEVETSPAELMEEESTKEEEQCKNGQVHELDETEKDEPEEKMEVLQSQEDNEDDVEKTTETEPGKVIYYLYRF